MPSLGADMEEGTLLEWRVAVGDQVNRGDVIAVVDTDKAAIDVEVFTTGVVEELLVPEGERVPVGTPLARIADRTPAPGGETPTEAAPTPPPEPPPAGPTAAVGGSTPGTPVEPAPQPFSSDQPTPDPIPVGVAGHRHASLVLSPVVRRLAIDMAVDTSLLHGSGPGGRITRDDVERAGHHRHRVTPRARRLALEQSIDTAELTGTGPGGTVRARDVERSANRRADAERPATPTPAQAPDRKATARAAIARTMERAWREIPHYRVGSTIDLEPALRWLEALNADRPPPQRILAAAVLLRATALAATEVPELNGWWLEGELRHAERVDLGAVVSLRGGGVVTPTIGDAAGTGLEETMASLRRLVAAARSGGLRSSDMGEASITVTNLGDQGAEEVHGVIRPPQVALVGFGRIRPRPWAEGDHLEVRRSVVATLAADHRASDGRTGSRFLHMLERALSDPERLR